MQAQSSDRVAHLLQCPVGRNFLLGIDRDRVDLARALAPTEAFTRAADAVRALSPWSPRFAEALTAGRSRQTWLAELARQVLAHQAAQWWPEPMDPARQLLFSPSVSTHAESGEDVRWEGYAERPTGWRITSTAREGRACLDAVIAAGAGDWLQGAPYQRCAAKIGKSARVLEITSAADWHALCASHPRINAADASPAGAGALVPDWSRVAMNWDGVHLTFLALLTVPFVCRRSSAGSTMMWSWNTEGTIWLLGAPIRQA